MTVDKSIRNDLLAAFSLANLSLLGIWNALLNYTPAQEFFFARPPSRPQYLAAMLNVFLIGLVLFPGFRAARRLQDKFGASGSAPLLILMCIPTANAVFRIVATRVPRLGRAGSAVALLIVLGVVVAFTRRFFPRNTLYAVIGAVLVAISPLILIEVLASLPRCRTDRGLDFANAALAKRVPPQSARRIVWILFDELDYRLSFPDRPATAQMPEFDRLRGQALFAENAVPPFHDTLNSVPSLLTGVKLSSIAPSGPALAVADGVALSARDTIFSSIRGMGGNAGVAGWYLPYCRMFSGDLVECYWHAIDQILNETRGTFPEILARQQQSLFEYGYYSIFRESLRATHRIRMLRAIHDEALNQAVDPSLQMVFLHLPVPHPPFFYDRFSRAYTKRNAGQEGYADGLALADVFLGDIRAAMTKAGVWDTTTLLVTSDHSNRSAARFDGKEDTRVPFLLKLAGHSSPLPYRESMNTVVTKALLEAVFQGQVASPDQAANWLTAHRQ